MSKWWKSYRWKTNPAEKVFYDAWKEKEKTLEYLLSTNGLAQPTSDRDKLVAATVIQWLGSPVGMAFVADTMIKVVNDD